MENDVYEQGKFLAWDNEVNQNIKEIYRVTGQTKNIGKRLKTNDVTFDAFQTLYENISKP